MKRWLGGGTALATLLTLLACSSLGTCWRVFAACADECCQPDAADPQLTAQPCSSAAAHVSPATLAAPIALATLPYLEPRGSSAPLPVLFALVLPEKPPPLVLRI